MKRRKEDWFVVGKQFGYELVRKVRKKCDLVV